MFEPSWWLVFFAWCFGGAVGFWACATMAVAVVADAKDAQAHEHLPDGWQ